MEKRGAVAILTLNRPKALNALCAQLGKELAEVSASYVILSHDFILLICSSFHFLLFCFASFLFNIIKRRCLC